MNTIQSAVDGVSRALGSDEKARAADQHTLTKLVDMVSAIGARKGLVSRLVAVSFQSAGARRADYFIEIDVAPKSDGVSTTMTAVNDMFKHVLIGSDLRVASLTNVQYNDKSNSFHCKFTLQSSAAEAPKKTSTRIPAKKPSSQAKAAPKSAIKKQRGASVHSAGKLRVFLSEHDTEFDDAVAAANDTSSAADGDDEFSERVLETRGTVQSSPLASAASGALTSSSQLAGSGSGGGSSSSWWNPFRWAQRNAEQKLSSQQLSQVRAFEYSPDLFSFT